MPENYSSDRPVRHAHESFSRAGSVTPPRPLRSAQTSAGIRAATASRYHLRRSLSASKWRSRRAKALPVSVGSTLCTWHPP